MGGRKEGRETSMCERNIYWLPLACPRWETWLAIQACALTGTQAGELLVCGTVPNPLSHTGQDVCSLFSNPNQWWKGT